VDFSRLESLKAMLDEVDRLPRERTMPRRVSYPDLPKGKDSAAQLQRQWLSLLWSIESAAASGKHGLKGLTVALGRIVVARELEAFLLNAEEHQKPLRTVEDLLWDERLPLNAAGQSMQNLMRKLPRAPSVEMNETAVFPSPWDRWRLFAAIGGLGEGRPWGPWKQEPNNHYAVAWKPWPMVWVDNGNHSTMAALVRGGGKLKCKEAFDFTPVLE
jgi:hypothetical protein